MRRVSRRGRPGRSVRARSRPAHDPARTARPGPPGPSGAPAWSRSHPPGSVRRCPGPAGSRRCGASPVAARWACRSPLPGQRRRPDGCPDGDTVTSRRSSSRRRPVPRPARRPGSARRAGA
ncbi:hypothetical protein EYA84_04625 [Verrucosispora sp. SN26_14.1]|nr:hypothetical protein EYA84_04625 [Verrucosispora sp. SN26_14.1]